MSTHTNKNVYIHGCTVLGDWMVSINFSIKQLKKLLHMYVCVCINKYFMYMHACVRGLLLANKFP